MWQAAQHDEQSGESGHLTAALIFRGGREPFDGSMEGNLPVGPVFGRLRAGTLLQAATTATPVRFHPMRLVRWSACLDRSKVPPLT